MIRGGEAVRGVSGRAGASRGEGAAPRQISDVSVTLEIATNARIWRRDVGHDPSDAAKAHYFKARALFAPGRHPRPLTMSYSYLFKYIIIGDTGASSRPPASPLRARGSRTEPPPSDRAPFHHASPEGSEPRRHRHRGLPDPRLPARASPLLLAPPPPVYPARVRSTSPLPRAVPTRAPAPARFAHSPRPARAPPPFPSPRHAPQASASRACCCSSRTSGSSTSTT